MLRSPRPTGPTALPCLGLNAALVTVISQTPDSELCTATILAIFNDLLGDCTCVQCDRILAFLPNLFDVRLRISDDSINTLVCSGGRPEVCRLLRSRGVKENHSEIEILDATDPAVTQRICHLACTALLGARTFRFWYAMSELALPLALLGFFILGSSWWAAVVGGLLTSAVVQCARFWITLHFRMGIKPGDAWYVLDTEAGQAVALVKTRRGHPFIASAAADAAPLALSLSKVLVERGGTGSGNRHFQVPPSTALRL